MALNPNYFVTTSLEEYFVDKDTGLPLTGGYIVFFSDISRETPKTVYELSGAPPNYTYTPLPNPLDIGGSGYPVNANNKNVAIYYYPYDNEGNVELYYIKVYNSDNVLQFDREGWPNVVGADAPDDTVITQTTVNQISNGQFTSVLFNPEYDLTIEFSTAVTNQVYEIAPGWELVVTTVGSGSITLSQADLPGSAGIPTNPPFALNVFMNSGNITSAYLRQRMYFDPSIWATTSTTSGYLATSMVIASLDGTNKLFSILYTPSAGPGSQLLVTGSSGVSGYVRLEDTVLLTLSANPDEGSAGYVDIQVILPIVGSFEITSIQVVAASSNVTDVPYYGDSTNRQTDYLFHYYLPKLGFKAVNSYLVGWDFPSNPRQFGTSGSLTTIGAASSTYVWDQTILYQTAANSLSYDSNYGNLMISAIASTQAAVIQYLKADDCRSLFLHNLSALVVTVDTFIASSNTCGTISLWYTTDEELPNILDFQSIVQALDGNGKPVAFHGNWTELPRKSLGNAKFKFKNTAGSFEPSYFPFSGWEAEEFIAATSQATYFAIVIGTSILTIGDYISFNAISLVPGDIPSIPAPMSADETLRQCEYYYEKTYATEEPLGTLTYAGSIYCHSPLWFQRLITENNNTVYLFAGGFNFNYKTIKVKAPNIRFFSPTENPHNNTIQSESRYGLDFFPPTITGSNVNPVNVNADNIWEANSISTTGAIYFPIYANYLLSWQNADYMYGPVTTGFVFHYVADARLGTYYDE